LLITPNQRRGRYMGTDLERCHGKKEVGIMFMNLLKMIGMKVMVMGMGMMGRMYRLLYLGIEVATHSYDEMFMT
jgi:hypothetical protein